ncbi:MAG: sugar nucleotide-binding protein [Pseudomonadota bacterium]
MMMPKSDSGRRLLVLGSTGMLGQELTIRAIRLGFQVKGIARQGADYNLDITDDQALFHVLNELNPDIIINTIAIVDLAFCEENKARAYLVNTRVSGVLVDYATQRNAYLIQISTDHYYTGDKNRKHNEDDKITLVNEYARTKFLAEALCSLHDKSLIIRTNIVGYRSRPGSPTFLEWIVDALSQKKHMVLFDDYYCSTISVAQCSRILFDLINLNASGVINIGSRDVFSKKDFIEAFAKKKKYVIQDYEIGSVRQLKGVKRAESLGLDVSRAEAVLGYRMPEFIEVIEVV